MRGNRVLSNIVAGQAVHERYGGVVPELASRAHQKHIVPVVHDALAAAGISTAELEAIAFTEGPGLMGSLLVGGSFAKGLAISLGTPLVAVDHMMAHVLAHFIHDDEKSSPTFPFLCLTVSGGHTQLVLVRSALDMEVVGHTLDDAAGEAFDKAAKLLNLGYPGGPRIQQLAENGNERAFTFSTPNVGSFDFSFSGIKTSFLYLVQREMKNDPEFLEKRMSDLCASYQRHLVDYLLARLRQAAIHFGVNDLALAGGVSANAHLRDRFASLANELNMRSHIPAFQYCTDNAAMIGMAAQFKLQHGELAGLDTTTKARMKF